MKTYIVFPELTGSDSYFLTDGRFGKKRLDDVAHARAMVLILLLGKTVTHYTVLKGPNLGSAKVISTHPITIV